MHRLLQTLASRGYVTQVDQRYTVTTRLWELGAMIISRLDVARVAAPVMQRLVAEVDETAHLSVLDMAACEVVSIHNVESTQPVRAYSRIGQRTPAHCVATGKALLSVQSPEALRALPEELQRFTLHTLHRREDLLVALEKIRRDGYSTNVGEWREQVGGAAAVIYDHTGRPAGGARPDSAGGTPAARGDEPLHPAADHGGGRDLAPHGRATALADGYSLQDPAGDGVELGRPARPSGRSVR